MKLSQDKISHLSHLIRDGLIKNNLAKINDSSAVLTHTKNVLTSYLKLEVEVDEIVRKKIETYKRNIIQGSREWDVLYRKHYEEEMNKRW